MRVRNVTRAAVGVLSLVGATVAVESDAEACGGCFSPPETPTVVSDHRMILTVSKTQSTLYDQIRYQGAPDAFAWVLPITGEVTLGLSADVMFGALDGMTQTQIVAPPRNCPPPPYCPNAPNASSAGGSSSSGGSGGVDVTKREVVGPYDTVQLKATDPTALQTWLADNGFSVPADVKPVIDQYVAEHFDFLALKLLPGKNVQDMRPVRVTTPGANVALPLRMVAAGTGATVGISLWVLGEGRYEPQNFPTFTIKADELLWDWNQNKSNYTDLRAQKNAAGQGKVWEIESSTSLEASAVRQAITYGYYAGGGPGGPSSSGSGAPYDPEADAYLPVKDMQGNVTRTAQQVREDDLATLFQGIPGGSARITRMRADLAHAALATDLAMGATSDQSQLDRVRNVTKEANQPQCPVYEGCDQVGTAPRDDAQARADGADNNLSGGSSCSTATPRENEPATWLALGAGGLALVVLGSKRRRPKP